MGSMKYLCMYACTCICMPHRWNCVLEFPTHLNEQQHYNQNYGLLRVKILQWCYSASKGSLQCESMNQIPCNRRGLSNQISAASILIKTPPTANYKACVTHNQTQSTDNSTFIIFIYFCFCVHCQFLYGCVEFYIYGSVVVSIFFSGKIQT